MLILIMAIHLIGSIIAIIINKKNGTFKRAKENGDGIRTDKPSDVLFRCLVTWEIDLFIFIWLTFDEFIDSRNW